MPLTIATIWKENHGKVSKSRDRFNTNVPSVILFEISLCFRVIIPSGSYMKYPKIALFNFVSFDANTACGRNNIFSHKGKGQKIHAHVWKIDFSLCTGLTSNFYYFWAKTKNSHEAQGTLLGNSIGFLAPQICPPSYQLGYPAKKMQCYRHTWESAFFVLSNASYPYVKISIQSCIWLVS